MARIALHHRPSLMLKAITALSTKTVGTVPDTILVALHHRGYAVATVAHEALASRWRTLSPTHQALAVMSSAREVGCSWCVDFGYWVSHHKGVSPQKLSHIAEAATHGVYTEVDRAVIHYAAAMSRTPPEVTDEMVSGLREHFSDKQLVELTALVALENQRSRMNAALGLTSQGFSDRCTIPATAS
ncbi:MAG: carboxymuconolactone decarboxylase family protein [Ornithinimicrobium sp.]